MSYHFLAVIITISALATGVLSPQRGDENGVVVPQTHYIENGADSFTGVLSPQRGDEDGVVVTQTQDIENGAESFTVTGLIDTSINLSITPNSLQKPPTRVTWKFASKNIKFKIADIEDNKLQPHYDQFEGRLEGFENGTVLHIKDVTKADEGTYYADVTLEDHQILHFVYNLTLYETAATPSTDVTIHNPAEMKNVSIPVQTEKRLYYFLVIPLLFVSIFAVILFAAIFIRSKRRKSGYILARTDDEQQVNISVEESSKPKHRSNVKAEQPQSEVFKEHSKNYSQKFITLHLKKETVTYHLAEQEKCEDPRPQETNNVIEVAQMDQPVADGAQQDDF